MSRFRSVCKLIALIGAAATIAPSAFAHGLVTVKVRTANELVAAMTAANANGRPTIIKLAAGTYELTQTFDSEVGFSVLPPVTGDIALVGADPSNTTLHVGIDPATGAGYARVLTVLKGGAALVRGLTLTGGVDACPDERDICFPNGGAGAINAGGILWIDDSEVSHGFARTQQAGAQWGGGVLSTGGYLLLTRTRINDNVSIGFGGGLAVLGGVAKVSRSRIESNMVFTVARAGGAGMLGAGVHVSDAKVWIEESTISGNHFTAPPDPGPFSFGAGVYLASGELHLTRSAVTENFTPLSDQSTLALPGGGGGIYNRAGRLWIKDSTVGGNSTGAYGGGLLNLGTAFIEGSTIARNQVLGYLQVPSLTPPGCNDLPPDPELCRPEGGGIWTEGAGVTRIARSVVALNVVNGGLPRSFDCGGDTPLISDGRNLIGNTSGCTLTRSPGAGPDLLDVNPKLGELEDNGEAGEAHFPLLAGSPVIDAGGRLGRFCELRDQLGARRADGNRDGKLECDIGAIEWHPSRH